MRERRLTLKSAMVIINKEKWKNITLQLLLSSVDPIDYSNELNEDEENKDRA
jgi:hypothetical protein